MVDKKMSLEIRQIWVQIYNLLLPSGANCLTSLHLHLLIYEMGAITGPAHKVVLRL